MSNNAEGKLHIRYTTQTYSVLEYNKYYTVSQDKTLLFHKTEHFVLANEKKNFILRVINSYCIGWVQGNENVSCHLKFLPWKIAPLENFRNVTIQINFRAQLKT